MHTNILVVYKKNFEEVHDMALATIRQALDDLVSENRVRVDYTARETVRRADFDGPDLVIVLGGDGTLTSIAHSIDDSTPIMGVWTSDIGRALRMSEKLKAGTVWVNTYRAVSFTSPFGGYKRSGEGRESGKDAIKEFLQVKSVWIAQETTAANPFIMR